MRTYKTQHPYYCGVDLHARTMFVNILDDKGTTRFAEDLPASPRAFLDAIKPYREGIVVGCECMFAWYWLADLCERERIPFVLGHALAMKAIHGGKAKNDKLDADKISGLLRGGFFPMAYVYPRAKRDTRDLLRRRSFFVRQRAQLIAHIQNTNTQFNLPPFDKKLTYKGNRSAEIAERFEHPSTKLSGDRTYRFEWPSWRNGEVSGASPLGGDNRLSLTVMPVDPVELFGTASCTTPCCRSGR